MGMNECPWERCVSAAKDVKLKEIKLKFKDLCRSFSCF